MTISLFTDCQDQSNLSPGCKFHYLTIEIGIVVFNDAKFLVFFVKVVISPKADHIIIVIVIYFKKIELFQIFNFLNIIQSFLEWDQNLGQICFTSHWPH